LARLKKNNQGIEGSVLWIGGKRGDSESYIPALRKKDLQIEVVQTGKAAVSLLESFSSDVMVVDAVSMRTSGQRICQALHQAARETPILLIVNPDNPVDNEPSIKILLKQPFTIRKLYNRIIALLPMNSSNSMKAGSLLLDLDRNLVSCDGREAKLTPRLSHLLRILMERPGQVIDREKLFQEVWNTEYTGDTRTLDVHISWLRKAFEKNPRKPQYLKTIRGVGYRLDL
jgi:DNA-binding response OmpR family regulator